MDKMFTAEFTKEAEKDLKNLDIQNQKRTLRAVALFERLGKDGVTSRPLNNGLFEIKVDKVRIYFKYHDKRIIIIGLITLKKTQKAPEHQKTAAIYSIEKYLRSKNNGKT